MKERSRSTRSGFTLIELLVVIAIIAILAAILFPVFAQARDKARQASCLSNCKQIGTGIMMYVQDYDELYPNGGHGTPGGGDPSNRWYKEIFSYVKNIGVYTCPSRPNRRSTMGTNGLPNRPGGYGCNNNVMLWGGDGIVPGVAARSMAEVADPAGTFIVGEAEQCTCAGVTNNTDPEDWVNHTNNTTDWQLHPPGNWANNNTAQYANCDGSSNQARRPMARHSKGLNIIYCDGHAKWTSVKQFTGVAPGNIKGWPYGHPNNSWDNR
jgi:prepilin-type N-terminal cleavage/methylation domain-containing protein/prepilin-type processing-associated H-X9-DG protein